MIVGGYFDIHPKRYGETKIHPAVKLNDVRENFEHELGARALGLESGSDRPKKFEEMARRASSEEGVYQNIHDRQAAQAQQSQNSNFTGRLPLLGICNGMQLINVLHGGSAIQHIPDEEKFMDHEQSHIKGFDDYHRNYHEVVIEKNSQLFAIIGEEKIQTNSSHHQAAKKDGQGLNVCAHASDGIIEAVEKINHPFCIGIQWHPEFDNSQADKKIFEGFVEAAKKYKKSK